MTKSFENVTELSVTATPEQVWDAIATGPGIDSWFMGRSEVEAGSVVRTAFGGYTPEQPVTAWDPPGRLAYGSVPAPDGRFVAYEFLVEGRAGGSTVIRAVTSGFLPGDDWADEYEAMHYGTQLFFATLVEYLRHFPGRPTTPVTAFGPPVTDWPAAWTALHKALGLGPSPRPGDELPGGGQVYHVNQHTIGLRTTSGLYRYIRGFHGTFVASHALITADDTDWPTFLAQL